VSPGVRGAAARLRGCAAGPALGCAALGWVALGWVAPRFLARLPAVRLLAAGWPGCAVPRFLARLPAVRPARLLALAADCVALGSPPRLARLPAAAWLPVPGGGWPGGKPDAGGGQPSRQNSTDGTSVSSGRQRWNIGVVAIAGWVGLESSVERMGPAGYTRPRSGAEVWGLWRTSRIRTQACRFACDSREQRCCWYQIFGAPGRIRIGAEMGMAPAGAGGGRNTPAGADRQGRSRSTGRVSPEMRPGPFTLTGPQPPERTPVTRKDVNKQRHGCLL
jgi:hypothetical protein